MLRLCTTVTNSFCHLTVPETLIICHLTFDNSYVNGHLILSTNCLTHSTTFEITKIIRGLFDLGYKDYQVA